MATPAPYSPIRAGHEKIAPDAKKADPGWQILLSTVPLPDQQIRGSSPLVGCRGPRSGSTLASRRSALNWSARTLPARPGCLASLRPDRHEQQAQASGSQALPALEQGCWNQRKHLSIDGDRKLHVCLKAGRPLEGDAALHPQGVGRTCCLSHCTDGVATPPSTLVRRGEGPSYSGGFMSSGATSRTCCAKNHW
jgi:hypothetical protein